MRRGVKIFGTFNGIAPDAFERLKPHMPFDEVEYSGTTVEIAHDGAFHAIEDLVLVVMDNMTSGHESGLDVIDHDANMLTRYAIEADGFRCREMNMDDVVQAYPNAQ